MEKLSQKLPKQILLSGNNNIITLKLDLQKHIFGLLLHHPEGICSKSKMAEKYSCLNIEANPLLCFLRAIRKG